MIHNDEVMFHSKLRDDPNKAKEYHLHNLNCLNGFTAEQLLYAVKYKCHCHLMVDVVTKQPVIKILISKLLKTIGLRIW